jgi:hypothetical protein
MRGISFLHTKTVTTGQLLNKTKNQLKKLSLLKIKRKNGGERGGGDQILSHQLPTRSKACIPVRLV